MPSMHHVCSCLAKSYRMIATELALLQHRMSVEDDQNAFIAIVHLFQKPLHKFAMAICHNREDAEEIVEDVFVRIWLKRKSIDQINNLRLYMFLATRNNALNYLRAKKGITRLNIDDMALHLEASYLAPDRALENSETMQRFAAAIEALPHRCRVIFKLLKEEGLKQREVAEILDLSVKTVENQMAIAIKRLAKVADEMDLPGKRGGLQQPGKVSGLKNFVPLLWGFIDSLVSVVAYKYIYGQYSCITYRQKTNWRYNCHRTAAIE